MTPPGATACCGTTSAGSGGPAPPCRLALRFATDDALGGGDGEFLRHLLEHTKLDLDDDIVWELSAKCTNKDLLDEILQRATDMEEWDTVKILLTGCSNKDLLALILKEAFIAGSWKLLRL